MMRSMYSAVSAIKAHQLRMDVIGNNIANVNTIGYKGSRATFKDVFSQTLKGSGSPQDNRGGTNPMQVGLGIDVSTIDTIHTQGVTERTDNPSDVMISGEGFFIVSDDSTGLNKYYTRAGNFTVDTAGNLVNPEGLNVMGYTIDEKGNESSSLSKITIPKNVVFEPKATTEIGFTGNLDTRKTATTTAQAVAGDGPDDATGPAYIKKAGPPVTYSINAELKKSVVWEAASTVWDSLGGKNNIKFSFVKTETTAGDPATTEYKVLAFYIKDDGTMIPASGTDTPADSTAAGNGVVSTLKFDTAGKLLTQTPATLELNIPKPPNGADAVKFKVNLNGLTQFEGDSSVSENNLNDGYAKGEIKGYSISPDGTVQGVFSNGRNRALAKIALAKFNNPPGLMKIANNLYKDSNNSGNAQIGKPSNSGFGELNPGALEMSNVDLGREFTNMITTQRGFQANSRVVTTTDQMLEELVNLKR